MQTLRELLRMGSGTGPDGLLHFFPQESFFGFPTRLQKKNRKSREKIKIGNLTANFLQPPQIWLTE